MAQTEALSNPYVAGSPVSRPEMFFGREDVFEFVRGAFVGQQQDNVLVLVREAADRKDVSSIPDAPASRPPLLAYPHRPPGPDYGQPRGPVLGNGLDGPSLAS